MFEPLYTAGEMRAAEEGHDVEELMRRAGAAVAEEVLRRFPGARSFAAVCGGGANGGDGRIAAELLRAAGWEERALGEADVVIDALFGTGFRPPPRDEAAAQIRAMNASGSPVVAVDIPSGVNASTGEVPGEAVDAAVTVTFHGRKVGLEVAPGRFRAGEVVVSDIGLEHRTTELARVLPEIVRLVPRRIPGDTKYTAGSVLVVGGSPGMTGAVTLTAEAAFRADAGYVAVAAPPESLPVIETRLREAVKRPLDEAMEAAARAGALAIGPGLGPGHDDLVHRLLKDTDLPAVIDADGLRELKPFDREAPTVLTPHSGELGRLLGEEASWVDEHRSKRCVVQWTAFAASSSSKAKARWSARRTKARSSRAARRQLATAGTGDVLTGVVAAFLAKGMEPRLAAAAAVRAHTDAVAASGRRSGLMAGDLLDALPRVLDA